jgi:hypothetical protein
MMVGNGVLSTLSMHFPSPLKLHGRVRGSGIWTACLGYIVIVVDDFIKPQYLLLDRPVMDGNQSLNDHLKVSSDYRRCWAPQNIQSKFQPQLDPILLGPETEFSDHVIHSLLVAVPERLVSAIKLMNVASSSKFEI